MQSRKDPDVPEYPRDNEKELSAAEFTSPDLVDRVDTAIAKHRIFAEAVAAGVDGVKPSLVEKQAGNVADNMERLCRTYSMTAIQAGPVGQERAIPKIIDSIDASRKQQCSHD